MLDLTFTLPALARRAARGGAVSSPAPAFPPAAFAYWEGQGQSNMTGSNEIADAPAASRVMNPHVEMMTDAPGWRPYGLLAIGESAALDGVTYDGKFDEAETPAAAGGAGPLIGVHEAVLAGAMNGVGGFMAAGVLMGKFSDAGKPLTTFLPDYDDGTPPLGGANFNARGGVLPGLMRARLAEAQIYHQGKIWLQGEADAAAARAAADLNHPQLTGYAAGLASLRAFERAQFGAPALPWYMVAIAETDAYAAAVNDALASLCRWHVAPDGSVSDLGAGRDATSYIIDHMILPGGGDVHFNMTAMRQIGALVWAAHQHMSGGLGATTAHPVTAILPVWQQAPATGAIGADTAEATGIANEDGTLHALALPAGSPTPEAATIIASGVSAAGLRGRVVTATATGLAPETDYDIWCVYAAASGERTAPAFVTATTSAATLVSGWSPADAGPLGWWDAQDAATVTEDAGAVTAWADKSGGGVTLAPTATAQRPTLNAAGLGGFPALDFDGDDDLEGTGVALAADMCLIVVAEVDLVTNGSEALIDFKNQKLTVLAQNSAEFRARFQLMNGANTNISPSPIVDYSRAPHIFVGRYVSATDTVEVWIDGVVVASQSTYTVDIAGTDDLRVMRAWGTALRLDGKVGEIALIGSSDSADRERLEGYAAHRWGLAGLLPAGHPWKNAAP